MPAAVVTNTCANLSYDRTRITVPRNVDLIVNVDQGGRPTSATYAAPGEDRDLVRAAIDMALSCSYAPAIRNGEAVFGSARLVLRLIPEAGLVKLERKPAIINAKECSPTASDYPALSIELEQTGKTVVRFTVDKAGRLANFGVVKSSGHLLLDFTALVKLAGCKFQPGLTSDGSPIAATFDVEYEWRLD